MKATLDLLNRIGNWMTKAEHGVVEMDATLYLVGARMVQNMWRTVQQGAPAQQQAVRDACLNHGCLMDILNLERPPQELLPLPQLMAVLKGERPALTFAPDLDDCQAKRAALRRIKTPVLFSPRRLDATDTH